MARWIAAIVGLVCVALFACFKWEERQFRLSHVPAALNVSTVLYANEQSWGLPFFPLPGDNETGVIVYELPPATAKKIEEAGIEYFEKLPRTSGNGNLDWRGYYDEWKRTPVSELEWVNDPIDGSIFPEPTLDNFLSRYGFWIPVDPDVARLINEAVANPGSYYARGRAGTLIVIPAKRKAAYVYVG